MQPAPPVQLSAHCRICHLHFTQTPCSACRQVNETKKAEMSAAEARGKAEAEQEGLKRAVAAAEGRCTQAQAEGARLEAELKDYKVGRGQS